MSAIKRLGKFGEKKGKEEMIQRQALKKNLNTCMILKSGSQQKQVHDLLPNFQNLSPSGD